ncbi:MAG TPA: helix-turn-helix transcriptional regulator [Bacteroidia bacterium]|nr:helix-turn-helix transcriptional regulator [Bacteroidia bacterium]
MKVFGDYVRQLRKDKDWTLTKLAAMLDMDSANLSKIETGKRSFDEKKLPVFCKIFSLDLGKMKKELISEKFAYKVYSENVDGEVFKLAEQKVKYLNRNDKH